MIIERSQRGKQQYLAALKEFSIGFELKARPSDIMKDVKLQNFQWALSRPSTEGATQEIFRMLLLSSDRQIELRRTENSRKLM